MKITIETDGYNFRRYGKPWVAKVDFAESTKGNFAWGSWTGDHYNGGEGILEIEANPGDIIATGQKDFRKPRNSAPQFYVITDAGQLSEIGDKGQAYKYYLQHQTATPDVEALRAERGRLAARIAEIDEILKA